MRKTIIQILAIAVFVVIQLSFLNTFDFFRSYSHTLLVVIVFLFFQGDFRLGLTVALTGGILFDLYSGFGFGIITITFTLCSGLTWLLLNNVLTHRSLLTLINLLLITTVSYNIIFLGFSYLFYITNVSLFTVNLTNYYILNVGRQIVFNIIIGMVIYFAAKLIQRTLGQRFILKGM